MSNLWTPINKVTGAEYPAVDDAGRKAYETDRQTAGKYRFKVAPADAPKAAAKPAKEKATPIKPIGVPDPMQPKEEKEILGDTAL